MPDKLLNETLTILRNSLDSYFTYIESYNVPSKSVMNYLVCESFRRCFGEKYVVETGMKDNVDNEKENHKIKSLSAQNEKAFGLLISFSNSSSKEIKYKKYFGGNCISQGIDVISC